MNDRTKPPEGYQQHQHTSLGGEVEHWYDLPEEYARDGMTEAEAIAECWAHVDLVTNAEVGPVQVALDAERFKVAQLRKSYAAAFAENITLRKDPSRANLLRSEAESMRRGNELIFKERRILELERLVPDPDAPPDLKPGLQRAIEIVGEWQDGCTARAIIAMLVAEGINASEDKAKDGG